MRLNGKVAIITGGASGIGEATVNCFLANGAKVVLADYNNELGLKVLAQAQENGYSGNIEFVRTDVSAEDSIINLISRTVEIYGGVDIMFNNAGVGGVIGPIWELDACDWDYTFDVLVKGVFLGIKHAAKQMRAQNRGGIIVNTASIAGLSGGCGPLTYSSAKAAVINLTRSSAIQLAEDNIRVNAICPGFIQTGLTQSKTKSESEVASEMSKMQPNPSNGKSEDISAAVLFLSTNDSRFVNGESIVVDGGLTALGPNYWEKWGITPERDMKKNILTKGTTGESTVSRKFKP